MGAEVNSFAGMGLTVKENNMKANGIAVSQVHARNDTHTTFKVFQLDLPGVTKFVERQVSIPVHWKITEEERAYIAAHTANMFAIEREYKA
jgi:perosamine synthetase